jgi:O-antigen chain-terminating methyltransferase
MIESNNPEIDVDELMKKIREELMNRSPDIESAKIAPTPLQSQALQGNDIRIQEHLHHASQHAEVGSRLLPMQRYPKLIRWLARLVGRIVLYFSEVITFPQRIYNQSMLQVSREIAQTVSDLSSSIGNLQKTYSDHLRHIEQDLSKRISDNEKQLNEWNYNLTSRFEGSLVQMSYLKTCLSMQEQRIRVFLEEARKRLPEPLSRDQIHALEKEASHMMDIHYLAFEDRFRGTRREIKDRQRVYLPLLKEAGAGTPRTAILDVGCGRGEWLELLKEEGFHARGVDLNRVLVHENLQRDLQVTEGDALAYLRKMPDDCLGAVTAFHLIEHLPLNVLISFLDETVRVLRPGAVAIFETPNPENILVGANNFYVDPTHRNPLPASTTRFLAEARGLCRVNVKFLHPYGEEHRIKEDSELAKRFNEYFYGPQDYAVIGYKV